jgi:hypothetical protein
MKNNYQGPPNPSGCQQISYNASMVRAGVAKNYLQAMGMVRTFVCPCSKCQPLKRYANDTDASLNKSIHQQAEISRLQLKNRGLN